METNAESVPAESAPAESAPAESGDWTDEKGVVRNAWGVVVSHGK